jgi:hypothetical protein
MIGRRHTPYLDQLQNWAQLAPNLFICILAQSPELLWTPRFFLLTEHWDLPF